MPTFTLTRLSLALAAVALFARGVPAARAQQPDLAGLSLENLSSTEITSVSRKEQKLSEAAAAVFVISSEDIRRSGLTSIAELLRTVPGLEVAQIDANKWAVTSRGFNERYADRVLVLMDGRALQTPSTSGVDWDIQETLLDDIERIEVIRGPGATLWGANAMNGVINIITRNAADTQGLLVSGLGTVQDNTSAAVRFGAPLGQRAHFRVFGKFMDRRPSTATTADQWNDVRGGFRGDWELSPQTSLALLANAYRGRAGETSIGIFTAENPLGAARPSTVSTSGANATARWTNSGRRLDTTLQAFFDYGVRTDPFLMNNAHYVMDLEGDQHFQSGSRQDFNWGANFRYNIDRANGSYSVHFAPPTRSVPLSGTYFQYGVAALPNRLKFVLGTKLEHSFYAGFVAQPNFRAIFTPGERVSLWASAARAAATPSRIDSEIIANTSLIDDGHGNLLLPRFTGTLHLPAETLFAYEMGLRLAPHPTLSFDLATFINQYSNLHTNEPGAPTVDTEPGPIPAHLLLPFSVQSNGFGQSRGLELAITSHPLPVWKLSASYTAILLKIHRNQLSHDFRTGIDTLGSTPRNQFQLHSLLNLPRHFELDSAVYFVSSLQAGAVAPYTRIDLRAGWHPSARLDLSVGARNLLQSSHMEFESNQINAAAPIRRSAFAKATWRF